MKRTRIFVLVFATVICFHTSAEALDNDLITSYKNLFSILSAQMKIDTEVLNQFNKLINDYIIQGKQDFGISVVYFSSNIAIVNASLITGYGYKDKKVSSSNIKFIKQKFDSLYLPLYAHAVPPTMVNKYSKYVLEHSIIPIYGGVISFQEVRNIYFKHLDLTEIPPQGQLFVLKAITGFASGIALADGRGSLTVNDIETAKTVSCDTYPECGRMLAKKLFDFNAEYRNKIKKIYFGN